MCIRDRRDPIERSASNGEQFSPWLRLTLTTTTTPLLKDHVVLSDFRNICVAWICGSKKQFMPTCRLTGGFSSHNAQEFFVFNPNFVLYDDLFDKEKGLLSGDMDMLTIVCEVRSFTNDVRYVDSWLFHPLESVVSPTTELVSYTHLTLPTKRIV